MIKIKVEKTRPGQTAGDYAKAALIKMAQGKKEQAKALYDIVDTIDSRFMDFNPSPGKSWIEEQYGSRKKAKEEFNSIFDQILDMYGFPVTKPIGTSYPLEP